VGKIPLAEHQTEALKGKNSNSKVAEIPQRRFESRKTIEKKHVGVSALMSLSGRNPISGTYRHFSKRGKSQQRRNLVVVFEWGYSINGACGWMFYYGVILLLPPAGGVSICGVSG